MKNEKALNVLVVGAGMYVCGRGTDGYGTVLPALFQAAGEGLVRSVAITGTRRRNYREIEKRVKQLRKMFRSALPVQLNGRPEDADCAIVAVPDHLHHAAVKKLLKDRLHCLVVKPLAPTLKEVKDLIARQKETNTVGEVEFHKRYDRSNLKLRDMLQSGRIGDPLYFLVQYSQRKNIPLKRFARWVDRTNIFQYLAVHYIDIVGFASGAKPIRVMATGQKNFLKRQGVDTYDSIQGHIEWQLPSGQCFTSAILTNWIDPDNTSAVSDQRITAVGTKGRYEANQKDRGITMVTDEKGQETFNPDFSAFYGAPGTAEFSFQGYGYQSIRQFLADVSAVKEGKIKPTDLEGKRPTFRESIVPTAVIEAANKSLKRNGKWVKIKL